MSDNIRIQNYVNGQRVAPVSGKYIDNINPATGKKYSEVPDSEAIDVVTAIQAANKAFPDWAAKTFKERAVILNKIADIIERRSDELARAESRDMGKPLWLAKEADLPRTIMNFRYFAAKILTEGDMSTVTDKKYINYVLKQPIGVAGLIVPWNMPLYTLTWKLAPCLAMGNTAVCKPAELSPMTAFLLTEILDEAGVPPGVVNIIFGKGEAVGSTLVQHPGVRLISFTGGTETGGKLQKMTAGHFKKMSLELGGKNANIIFKDADIKAAVEGTIKASFVNSGQVCLSGSRLFVQDDIYKEFVPEFIKATQALKVGDPLAADTYMGPLVSKGQLDKTMNAVKQGREERGKISAGGERVNVGGEFAEGYFFAPTVIEDLTMCSEIWQEEIFGPVVTISPFKYPHEAVKWANTSSYGLSSSIWTKDLSRAHKVAEQIQAGTVWVNTWSMRDPRVPFGGTKASGVGREGGDYSMQFYSDIKTVCLQY